MFDIYLRRDNAVEFFEKVSLDNDSENFTDKTSIEVESSPSFYTANYRKKIGYRRTVAKNRFKGQRDGVYSERHDNRAFNKLCKKAASESNSSVIKRGYNDYLDDIEDEKKKIEQEIAKENYKNFLLEERNQAALTLLLCSAKIYSIDAELASIE